MKVINRLGGGGGNIYINIPSTMPEEITFNRDSQGFITSFSVPANKAPNGILTFNPLPGETDVKMKTANTNQHSFDTLPQDVKTIIINGNLVLDPTIRSERNLTIKIENLVIIGTIETLYLGEPGYANHYPSNLTIRAKTLDSWFVEQVKTVNHLTNITIEGSNTKQNQMPGLEILSSQFNRTNINQTVFPLIEGFLVSYGLDKKKPVERLGQRTLSFPSVLMAEGQEIIYNNEHLTNLHLDNLEIWTQTETYRNFISSNASLKNIYVPNLHTTNANFVEVHAKNQPLENIYTEADNVENLKAQLATDAANLVKPLPEGYIPLPPAFDL